MSNDPQKRSRSQLEAEIAAQREQLEATFEQLAYRAQPSVQMDLLATDLKQRLGDAKLYVVNSFEGAFAGRGDDIRRALGIVGGGAAVIGLVALGVRSQTRRCKAARQLRKTKRDWKRFTRQLGRVKPPLELDINLE